MTDSSKELLRQYARLTEFLGRALGPDYEVALHDLTDANRSLIAIANGHISGRRVGAPLTNRALSILRDKSYEHSDYRIHDYGLSVGGKELRSNTMFIKEGGRLIGMLCINFDDSRYRAVAGEILGLCHPDAYVASAVSAAAPEAASAQLAPETFSHSPEAVVKDAVGHELERRGVTAGRLTADERAEIITALDESGIFLIKGAVKDVAAGLGCSQASVYRYLARAEKARIEQRA